MKRPGWKPLFSLLFLFFELWLVFSLGKESCEDVDSKRNCASWRAEGHCGNETYRPYMELKCNETCEVCDRSVRTCPSGYFSCLGGTPQCVPIIKMCDCKMDCQTGHDETDCEWQECDHVTEPVVSFNLTGPTDPPVVQPKPIVRLNGSNGTFEIQVVVEESTELPPFPGQANNGIDCPAQQTACTVNKKCINVNRWCDGWIKDCPDGEDETDLCYKPVNRDAFKTSSQNRRVTVKNFFVTIQRMKHTHCPERAFSCKGACMDVVDLSSHRCACDPQCWMRNDCCIDVADECPKNVRPQGVIEQCSPNLFGKDEELSALVVEQCPGTATVFDSARCNDKDQPQGMKYFGAPVYSPDTDKHYRNFFCAKCNGVDTDDLIPWNIWFGCQSTEVDFQEDCDSLIYIPPLNHPPKTCRVRNFKDPSFDETIITTKQLEGLTVKRCQTVYAPVKYNNTLYRNPYCLYLHRYQVDDRNMSRLYTCDIDEELPTCGNGTSPCRPSFSCLSDEVVCDGKQDCEDRSDEPSKCFDKSIGGPCYPMFQCRSTRHQCFSRTKLCDSFIDCADGSDEENCAQETLTPRYIHNFHESLSRLSEYPRISNTYEEKEDPSDVGITSTSAITKKLPNCIKPLVFDGNNCKYTGNITSNKKYDEVYMKQLVQTYSYNITLSPLGFHRPKAMGNDPIEFLAKHLEHYPYQVIDFNLGEKVGKTVKAQMTTRALTKLEKRSMKNYNRTKKYEENYLQIGTEIYLVRATQTGIKFSSKVLDTKIDCQFDSSGPIVQVMCTGCAYVEYSSREYDITSTGHIQLKESGQILKYYEYELRSEGSILVCWETSNSNQTKKEKDESEAPMKVWFGVGYSLAFLVHFIAFTMQLFYGRKTTLRIFFINFTSMGVIWSFDALLCTVSASYSKSAQSIHLFGSLGTLAWLLIISFHLLLSVSDGSPAVYFSVDNLVFYHICGWLCPLGWVLLFFFLSTFEVVEDVTCLTDSRQNLTMNQSSEILHFPVWVLLIVIFFLLMIVIVTTKRLMSGKSGKVDMEVLGRRLEIKIMVFLLFMLQALPWIVSLCLKYFARGFRYHNAVFCLCCVVEGFYLIYILKALVDGNLEKLRNMTPTPDSLHKIAASPNSEPSRTPEMKPALPPKTKRGPRPPLYQRPVDHNYTPFPDRQRCSSHPSQDQYSHLQGGHLGGNRNGKKKEYYPVTKLANAGYSGSKSGSNTTQDHQYMPLVRGGDKARSPSQSPGSPRSRRRSKSGQGAGAVSNEPGYQPVTPVSDKGKHRVSRSARHSDQSFPPTSVHLPDYQQNDNPPPYRVSEGFSPEIHPCSSSEGLFKSPQDIFHNQNASPTNWDSSPPNPGVDTFKASYC